MSMSTEISKSSSTSSSAAGPAGMSYDPATGKLRYEFWQKQQETLAYLESGRYDIVAFLAGYRSGKTVSGARWLISNALKHGSSRWLAVGVSFEQAKSTTYRVLFEQLPGERTALLTTDHNGPEQSPIVADYNRQDHRLTLINDSIIQLGSADKWSRYAGDEYSAIWLDEPSHYGPELYDMREMLSTRLSADRGPGTMYWSLTGNGFNSAWSILEQREDAGGDPINDRIKVVRGSVLENPFVASDKKAKFQRQFGGTGREQQALHGGYANQEGLVYGVRRGDQILPSDAFGRGLPPIDDGYRVYGYDAGWKNPRTIVELGRTVGDHDLVVLDEFYQSKVHVDDAIAWLDENDKPDGVIAAEHEPSDIDDFESNGWIAKPADKSLEPGIADVRRRFNPPEGRPSLYVSEQCENLVRELYSYKEDDVGASNVEDHACDALRYAVRCVENGEDGGIGLATVSTH